MRREKSILESRLAQAAICLLIVVFFFTTAESALRIYNLFHDDREEVLRYRPDPDSLWGLKGHTFRDRSVEVEKPAGTFRIICMGDSSTYGDLVRQDQTYSAHLQRLFATKSPGMKIEVINGGISGFTSQQGLGFLASTVIRYSPDLVTFAFLNCDALQDIISDDQRFRTESRTLRSVKSLLGQLEVYITLKEWLEPILRAKSPAVGVKGLMPRLSIGRYRDNLRKMGAFCRERGVRALFINLPLDLHAPLQEDYRQCIRDTAREFGAPVADAFTLWLREPQMDMYVDFTHPTARGHERLAELLLALMRQYRLTEGRPGEVPPDAPFYRASRFPLADPGLAREYLFPGAKLSHSFESSHDHWTIHHCGFTTARSADELLAFYRDVRKLPAVGRFNQENGEVTLLSDIALFMHNPEKDVTAGHIVLITKIRGSSTCTVSMVVMTRDAQ